MIIETETVQPFGFDGLTIYDLTANLSTSSSLARIHVPPLARHRRARSQECEKYYYIISGQLQFTLENVEHNLREGDTCIVPRGQAFSYANITELPVELLLIHTPRYNPAAEVFDEQ